ncbi:MAG TPA: aminotransferase class I/II-fold pyridoxal phosphate-dependent enzyme [Bacillota bacterium]|nr:aminotransferase class I/II-fold pyridoxal phosphate-dependent enzyme [Bacillota bacterium]HQB81429.1 aminotransferase class I/II-fold pyridoxal phosphate-dependent enzyme [Bacillota bacterium]
MSKPIRGRYALDQKQAPLYEALVEFRKRRMVSFDVPGHKQGRGNEELTAFLGKQCLSVDVNAMKMLDSLIHPSGVIADAQQLAADAFGADSCFFLVNGTTSAVQAMILSSCSPGDKIIMPRNVHRSAINALILSRAVPVYVNPSVNQKLGIPLGMAVEDVASAIGAHPDAKAILVNNPTYYGVCADLKTLVELGHASGMRVLVDEAHGTHFYFSEELPLSGMEAGADMSAVSLHKTGGSLTQSSLLLLGQGVRNERGYIGQIINLTQTTSASYLLLASLDITRRNLALRGRSIYRRVIDYADYARNEINAIGGFDAFGAEKCDGRAFFAFDTCKLPVHTRAMGLSGVEVYDLLRDDYDIQIEFGDLHNFLAILSVGDRPVGIERLIAALADIRFTHGCEPASDLVSEYITPCVAMTPAEAFYSSSESLPFETSLGRIAAESVMCYPPGIPILAPGECVTQEALEYIRYAREMGSRMTGTEDPAVEHLQVVIE